MIKITVFSKSNQPVLLLQRRQSASAPYSVKILLKKTILIVKIILSFPSNRCMIVAHMFTCAISIVNIFCHRQLLHIFVQYDFKKFCKLDHLQLDFYWLTWESIFYSSDFAVLKLHKCPYITTTILHSDTNVKSLWAYFLDGNFENKILNREV